MLTKTITIAALVMACAVATADFRTVTRAHEVMLNDLRLPITPSGTLGIRQCAQCEAGPIRVTTATRYRVNGELVDLREFRRLALAVRDRSNAFVTVMHHLETDTVTEISLHVLEASRSKDRG